MEKGRKIVKSYLGITFSITSVIGILVCFAAGIYYIHLYSSISSFNTINEERIMRVLGFSPLPLLALQKEKDRIYVYLSLSCYLVACFPHLYVHLRVLIEPSFAAGCPDPIVNIFVYNIVTNSVLNRNFGH
jgi:hypothetical protein